MPKFLYALTVAAAVLAATLVPDTTVRAQPVIAANDVAPTGKLRAGINLGNAVLAQKSKSGELGGITVDLARELGKRLGVPVELVEFQAAGKSFEAMAANELDVAFFAIEPKRAAEVEFSPPYVVIEGAYMVPKDSPFKHANEVDRAGIRIGTSLGSAYDLYLTRTLKQATLIRAKVGGGQATIDLFYEAKPDAAAGVRQVLEAQANKDPNVRVLPGAFQEIRQAMGTPKGREAAARYVHAFVEEMKTNGFVADGLKRSGQDATVAPLATK